jgi:hypothetical protein
MACREHAKSQPLESAVLLINDWWFRLPWQPYYLHWEDQADWPDPWQLLYDNIYCDLARGLGICYTLAMIDHPDIQDLDMIQCNGVNLVRVNSGKYILNYESGSCVNTILEPGPIQKCITQQQIKNRIE